MMRLVIVTVNYNGSESTIKLLKSLSEQTDKEFSVFVIDNASDEADFNNLNNNITKGTFAKVPFVIRNDKNLGFSGGNNVGIKEALKNDSNWVVLLNNDTWVESGFMVSLKTKLSQLDGIVGIPLNEGDHTAYCGKIEWLKPTLEHVYKPVSLQADKLTDHYAIGGAVAIHKDVFEKIGFMDEKYFLYFEDADFSIMAQKAGFKLTFLEDPKVYHQVSSTTKKLGSLLLLRYHYRNALYFNLKNGPWYIKLLVWPWSIGILLKQIIKIFFMYKQEQSVAILRGFFDFYKGRMGKIKTGTSQ